MTLEHSRKQQNVGYTTATIGCSLKQPKRKKRKGSKRSKKKKNKMWYHEPLGVKQVMLVSIVSCFSNMWFLLCLEIQHAHWLNGCVSGNPAFWLLLLHVVFVVSGNPVFSLGECLSSPEGGSIFVVLCILIGWVVWRRRRPPLFKWTQIVL